MAVFSLATSQDYNGDKNDLIDSLRDNDINVLVVDDDQLNVGLLKQQLQLLGCAVDSANSGFAGLELWDLNSYDVVFTDCNMPRMGGEQFIQFLTATSKFDPALTHIIAISADHSIPRHNPYISAGATCLQYKPLNLAKLHHTICECLDLRSAHRWRNADVGVFEWPMDQVVNSGYLKEVMGNDSQTQGYLAELFLKQAPEILTELRIAVRVGRYPQLAHLVHKLKSSAFSVGADRVASTCATLEVLIQAKEGAQIDTTIDKIETQLMDFEQYWAANIIQIG